MKHIIILILLFCTGLARAQWVPTNGPGGSTSEITSITANGNLLLAGTNSGLYLSTNTGNTWTATGLMNQQQGLSAVIIHGGKIFASADSGIYISGDNGISWSRTSINIPVISFYSDGINLFSI